MNYAIHKPLFGKQDSQKLIQESRNQAKNIKIPESHRQKFRVADPMVIVYVIYVNRIIVLYIL